MSLGAFSVCLAYALHRVGRPGGTPLYWAGEMLMIFPYLVRVLGRRTATRERLALLAGLAVLQSLLAWAYSPDQFRFPDELQHLRTLEDILRTGHLYTPNTYLAVSPGFPGLEVVTTAVHDLTGLPPYAAGRLVVSVCHVLVPLMVFGFIRELTGSERAAAVGAVVYGTALHQPYYNTLFVYGAVALPFMMLTLWAAWRCTRSRRAALAVLPPFLVVMVTHHVTAAFTTLMLICCIVVLAVGRVSAGATLRLFGVTTVATGALVAWTLTKSPATIGYLGAPVRSMLESFQGTASGLRTVTRVSPPRWESLTSMAGVSVALLLIMVGFVALWRSNAPNPVIWFAFLGAAYPAILAIRVLSPRGTELAARGLTFVMILAALPVAAALTWLWRRGRRVGAVIAIVSATAMAASSLTAGLPPWWERLPGRFLIGGYESGVDRSVELAGRWAALETQPGSRAACDVSVCSVVASYARATVSTTASDVYYGNAQRLPTRLGELSLDYLYVDRRMTEALPITGLYFFHDDEEGRHSTPFDPELLVKFDVTPGIDRVYDNGFIQAYDTRRAWS